MYRLINKHLIIAMLFAAMTSCQKTGQVATGRLQLKTEHFIGERPLELNKLIYNNAAGNQYLVTEVQWFISRLNLVRPDGSKFELNSGEPVYFDTGIPTSLSKLCDDVPAGAYTALEFTFGLDENQNKSLRYTNPPESFMFWPDYLGGGYHYLKLNGKWLNQAGLLEPFNFHLGIGQVYDSSSVKSAWIDMNQCCKNARHCEGYNPPQKTPPIIGFVHNHFRISLPANIVVHNDKTTTLVLRMDIDQWFREPHVYDHNQWGGSIMQQQVAMQMGCENGRDVFTINTGQ